MALVAPVNEWKSAAIQPSSFSYFGEGICLIGHDSNVSNGVSLGVTVGELPIPEEVFIRLAAISPKAPDLPSDEDDDL